MRILGYKREECGVYLTLGDSAVLDDGALYRLRGIEAKLQACLQHARNSFEGQPDRSYNDSGCVVRSNLMWCRRVVFSWQWTFKCG